MRIGSSLTAELIKYIREKPVSNEDLEQAGLFTLDVIGCIVAGRATETGERLSKWAGVLSEAGGGLGSLDPARQAFLSGACSHLLELHPTHRLSMTAPGCAVVPAVLALGHGLPVRDVLTAVLHGVEIITRIGAATGDTHSKIWDSTSTFGPFGSALASANLLGLDHDQTVAALGNAGTQASGLWEFISTGTDTKALHAGRAAEAGLVAATLSALELSGPTHILEGQRGLFAATCPDGKTAAIMNDRRSGWKIHELSFSMWPFSNLTHPAISAAFEARKDLEDAGADPAGFTRVEVETFQAAAERCDRINLATARSARYSLQHAVLCALWFGEVDLSSFSEETRQTLATKRHRTSVSATLDFSMRYPENWGARVTVHHPKAGMITKQSLHAKGDPENPISSEELIEKADALLDYGKYAGSEGLAMLAEAPTSSEPFEVSIF